MSTMWFIYLFIFSYIICYLRENLEANANTLLPKLTILAGSDFLPLLLPLPPLDFCLTHCHFLLINAKCRYMPSIDTVYLSTYPLSLDISQSW